MVNIGVYNKGSNHDIGIAMTIKVIGRLNQYLHQTVKEGSNLTDSYQSLLNLVAPPPPPGAGAQAPPKPGQAKKK